MSRKTLIGISLATAVLFGSIISQISCTKLTDPWERLGGPPRVVVSFPPLYCFVKNVGGDDVGVITLCSNVGPHQYEFNVKDTLILRKADLFLANGLGLDRFTDSLTDRASHKTFNYIKLAEQLPENLLKENHDAHDSHEGHTDHHHDGVHDPHVWLGLPQAEALVGKIRDLLKEADPPHAKNYDLRAEEYLKKLKKLHDDGRALLHDKPCAIVSMHESLGYFADSFGIDIVGSIEPQPGSEPNAKELRELVEACKAKKARVIAIEPQYPRDTAAKNLLESLRKQGIANPEMIVIDPLETADANDLTPDWYERQMRKNLETLADHLK